MLGLLSSYIEKIIKMYLNKIYQDVKACLLLLASIFLSLLNIFLVTAKVGVVYR